MKGFQNPKAAGGLHQYLPEGDHFDALIAVHQGWRAWVVGHALNPRNRNVIHHGLSRE
jgi:hypothetical protein